MSAEENRAPNAGLEESNSAEQPQVEGDETQAIIRRILVALDASPHSLAALQAATELAVRLNAELEGLYVEDINLVRVSDLPLARELSVYSAVARPYDRSVAERQMRLQGRQAERALADIARRASLTYTFRVAHGSILRELLSAALGHDLIILGKSGWNRQQRLGSTAWAVARQFPHLALLLQYGARLSWPIAVVYDGSSLAKRALNLGAQFYRGGEEPLFVLLMAQDLAQAREHQQTDEAWADEYEVSCYYRWLVRPRVRAITGLAHSEDLGALILPGDIDWLSEVDLAATLRGLHIPVFLVR